MLHACWTNKKPTCASLPAKLTPAAERRNWKKNPIHETMTNETKITSRSLLGADTESQNHTQSCNCLLLGSNEKKKKKKKTNKKRYLSCLCWIQKSHLRRCRSRSHADGDGDADCRGSLGQRCTRRTPERQYGEHRARQEADARLQWWSANGTTAFACLLLFSIFFFSVKKKKDDLEHYLFNNWLSFYFLFIF